MKTLHSNGKQSNSRPQNRGIDQSNLKLDQKQEEKKKQNKTTITYWRETT